MILQLYHLSPCLPPPVSNSSCLFTQCQPVHASCCTIYYCISHSTVQFSSVTQTCLTLCDPMNCSMPGLPVHHQLPESTQTHVHWVGDAIQPSYPLLSPSPPAFNLSQPQGFFQWVSSSHQVAKILEFQLQHLSFQQIFRTDFFRIDWFDLLAVQGTLKSLLQHHSSKASMLQCSAFFIVQLSHPYMTTGKTIALTRWTFVCRVMQLLLNMLSRFVIAFQRSKRLFSSKEQFSSVQLLNRVWLFVTHESQHARPPCPSPTPGVHSDSCPLNQWCHPAISSSVVPFSSCPQSLPASESFPMSQLFAWGGQSSGVSALASFLLKNTQDWSPLGWTGWISL